MNRFGRMAVLGLALTLALLAGPAGCTRREAGQQPDQRPRVDRALMACLGAIRAYHRQADLQMARSRPGQAREAVAQILSMKCIRRANPEIQEAVLDAYGRLARLHMQQGKLDEAARWLAKGMQRKGPPSFFRANLYMVRGDLLDARAGALDKAGRKTEADKLRRQAIDAFERSSKMNRRLLQDLVR
jgi:tetratricopeptide (TPR) repeat protein